MGSARGWGGPYGDAHWLTACVIDDGATWLSRLGTAAPEAWFATCVGYPTFPRASACNDSIRRFAACLSASRSSAVWRLKEKYYCLNIENSKRRNDIVLVFQNDCSFLQFSPLIDRNLKIINRFFQRKSILSEKYSFHMICCYKKNYNFYFFSRYFFRFIFRAPQGGPITLS